MTFIPLHVENIKDVPSVKFDPISPTIFHQNWWLDAASGGCNDEITIKTDGKVVGRLPFIISRRFGGRTICTLPELTHFLGPAIDAGKGSAANQAVKQNEITRELLENLPRTSCFWQKMHAQIPDMLPFQEKHYDVNVQFTYELYPDSDTAIWKNMRDKTRNVIRRASEKFTCQEMHDCDEYVDFYIRNLTNKNMDPYYKPGTIRDICARALDRQQGRILAAQDTQGQTVAAIFYVWDARASYYLMTSRTPEAGNGAVSLLVWQAILDSTQRGLVFDFDGVGTVGSSLFFKGFGGKVSPRYIALRRSTSHKMIDLIESQIKWPAWSKSQTKQVH